MSWRAALAQAGGDAVVALVLRKQGSAPREEGALMALSAAGAFGTIGGGAVEAAALARCGEILAVGNGAQRMTFALGPELDQCCGGRLEVGLFYLTDAARRAALRDETLETPFGATLTAPRLRPVLIYGAGHVGRALARALAPLPFSLRWIDARADAFPADAPCPTRATPLPEAEAAAAPVGAFHVIVTHSHALDLEIAAAALRVQGAGFVGVIGSKTKAALFRRRLTECGLDPDRLICPIGLPQIAGRAPEVIAASVAAQLLIEDAR